MGDSHKTPPISWGVGFDEKTRSNVARVGYATERTQRFILLNEGKVADFTAIRIHRLRLSGSDFLFGAFGGGNQLRLCFLEKIIPHKFILQFFEIRAKVLHDSLLRGFG